MNVAVIGASPRHDRYSNIAIEKLQRFGHRVTAYGLNGGTTHGIKIIDTLDPAPDIDTVTMYVAPANQVYWKDFILSLHPRRIIFNPGSENPELKQFFINHGIECLEACTLVMLSIGLFDYHETT